MNYYKTMTLSQEQVNELINPSQDKITSTIEKYFEYVNE